MLKLWVSPMNNHCLMFCLLVIVVFHFFRPICIHLSRNRCIIMGKVPNFYQFIFRKAFMNGIPLLHEIGHFLKLENVWHYKPFFHHLIKIYKILNINIWLYLGYFYTFPEFWTFCAHPWFELEKGKGLAYLTKINN